MPREILTCGGCGSTAESRVAIDTGWTPDYWDDDSDREVDGPFCPSCITRLGLLFDDEIAGHYKPIGGGDA